MRGLPVVFVSLLILPAAGWATTLYSNFSSGFVPSLDNVGVQGHAAAFGGACTCNNVPGSDYFIEDLFVNFSPSQSGLASSITLPLNAEPLPLLRNSITVSLISGTPTDPVILDSVDYAGDGVTGGLVTLPFPDTPALNAGQSYWVWFSPDLNPVCCSSPELLSQSNYTLWYNDQHTTGTYLVRNIFVAGPDTGLIQNNLFEDTVLPALEIVSTPEPDPALLIGGALLLMAALRLHHGGDGSCRH